MQQTCCSILLATDRRLLAVGALDWVYWNIEGIPHMVVFGDTGTGKTYAVKSILAHMALQVPGAKVCLCDFKGEDYTELDGCKRYYPPDRCSEGLADFMAVFEARRSRQDLSRSLCLLCFDEWTSYLDDLDKKDSEQAKRHLSSVLRMGRSLNCHVVVIQQRPDADYFKKSRDNFGMVVALGNLSKEAAGMFDFDRSEMMSCDRPGQGHVLVNRSRCIPVQFSRVTNPARLVKALRSLVGDVASSP